MVYTLHLRVSLWKWFVVLLSLSLQANAMEELCSEEESVDISKGTIDADGNIDYDGVHYSPSQYFQDEDVQRRGCICLVRQCIYVCEAEEWPTELYANVSDAFGKNNSIRNLATDTRYHLLLEEPACGGAWLTLEQDEVTITTKGDLSLSGYILNYPQFCMQPVNEMGEFLAAYCEPEINDLSHHMYAFGFLVSLPFLVATFVVYAILPELQNVSGKSLMCFVAALAVSYLLLGLARMDIYEYQSNMCLISAYSLYFTLMASFFWINIMSFDICWTFGGSCGRTSERRKFLYYSLYAWGVPLLLLLLILLFDHTELINYNLRPNIGEEGCFLQEEGCFLMLVISTNIFLLAITAKRVYQNDRTNVVMNNDNLEHHATLEENRNRFGLYLRLFAVMGVLWSLEIISWLLIETNTPYPSWVIYVIDGVNCLAGIVIFFLFVWKQNIKKLLHQRFCR
ncbi:G-protein coupled receptor Mth2-like [Anopheles aquasalis]|uniref:G-protein coupled receptor Mth2-like n=1 Tax=Anopheles aquasalis TaxID=42839 RepID=UPI00215AD243|nr:G-protein coupled receptor Mth2-like [Anopheles aquasalis]